MSDIGVAAMTFVGVIVLGILGYFTVIPLIRIVRRNFRNWRTRRRRRNLRITADTAYREWRAAGSPDVLPRGVFFTEPRGQERTPEPVRPEGTGHYCPSELVFTVHKRAPKLA